MYGKKLKHKFHAKPTTVDNIRFDSKLESRYYDQLKIRQKAGEVLFFLRQVPFHLSGGVKYVVDFVEFWSEEHGSEVKFVDVKGVDTPMSKMKRKQTEALYPIEITIVKKV